MLGLVATLSSTHCPSHPPLHSGTPSPPVLNRWLPEHLFTLGGGPRCKVCPSASPFRLVGFPHSFASFLAGVPVEPPPPPHPSWRCREDDTPFNTPFFPLTHGLSFNLHLQLPTQNKSLCKNSWTLSRYSSDWDFFSSPHTLVFFVSPPALCSCDDIWELPYGIASKTEIGLQMLRGAESWMRLAPLGTLWQKYACPPHTPTTTNWDLACSLHSHQITCQTS